MKLYRVGALIERDMRKFFRSPALMMTSMVFPLMQLVVLGQRLQHDRRPCKTRADLPKVSGDELA